MLKKLLLTALSSIAIASLAQAEPVPLTGAQIQSLLAGNTAKGTWNGTLYKQYFDTSGSTIYAPEKSRSEAGKWRVNSETNQYESWWERSGCSGYGISGDGDTYYWISTSLPPQPFTMLEGQQLAW